jgi:hypothetical protein
LVERLIALMMDALSTSETSVKYQAIKRNIPEDSHIQEIIYFSGCVSSLLSVAAVLYRLVLTCIAWSRNIIVRSLISRDNPYQPPTLKLFRLQLVGPLPSVRKSKTGKLVASLKAAVKLRIKLKTYNSKHSRRLNSIKSSRAHSRVNWLQEETDVSGTVFEVEDSWVACDPRNPVA